MLTHVSQAQAMRLERVEREARRDQHAAATPKDREALGLRARDVAGGFVMAVDLEESLLLNRALGLGLEAPLTPHVLREVLEHYRGGPPGFAINLCPFAATPDAESLLAECGFCTFFHHVKWWRGTEPVVVPERGLRVERLGAEQSPSWAALAARVFESSAAQEVWSSRTIGRAGWSHYFAFDGDAPIAVASMFEHQGAAWLGGTGTLEGHRRKGAQGALLARRLRDGLAAGVSEFALETAPDWPDLPGDSLRNAERAGFHPAYERASWIWPVP